MTPLERANLYQPSLRSMLDYWQAGIWTALPGIIDTVHISNTELTVDAHVAILGTVVGPAGEEVNVNIPPLHKLPVHFPGGGKVLCSFPIAPGDECLIVFCCRALDSWWQSGGVQPPIERRFHDLTDGVCIPMIWSQPNVPLNISTTTAQLRSKDGTTYVELDPDNQAVNVVAPGGMTITAPFVHATGAVIAGYGTEDQVGVQTHKHSQPPDSHGDTEADTNAPVPGT